MIILTNKFRFILQLLIVALAIGVLACHSTKNVNVTQTLNSTVQHISLSGQLYITGPEFDRTKCQSRDRLFHCWSKVLFLSDSEFVTAEYCNVNTRYHKGMYRFVKRGILFTYDSLCIDKERDFDYKTDTREEGLPPFITKINKSKTPPLLWKIVNCNGTIYFKSNQKETQYASPDNNKYSDFFIIEMKQDSSWTKLGLK